LAADSSYYATIPDGSHGWAGGAYERIEAENRARLQAAARGKQGEFFSQPIWHRVISPDGVLCFVTRFCEQRPAADEVDVAHAARRPRADLSIPDDLSIPKFLKCEPPAATPTTTTTKTTKKVVTKKKKVVRDTRRVSKRLSA